MGLTKGKAVTIADVVEQLPGELRALARRIPVESRAGQSVFELTQRVEYCQQLLAEADTADDEHKARLIRKKADRILQAVSLETLSTESARLTGELAAAHLRGDDRRAAELLQEVRALELGNPQPPADRLLAAAAVAAVTHVEGELDSIPKLSRKSRFQMRRH
jgi:hypothetical protein